MGSIDVVAHFFPLQWLNSLHNYELLIWHLFRGMPGGMTLTIAMDPLVDETKISEVQAAPRSRIYFVPGVPNPAAKLPT